MAKLSFDDGDGVWRTIGGRRIFIRTGESLSSAMKKSGKFKLSNKKKGEVRNESKSFNDIANENKKSLTRDELREKYGTDDVDLINAGKEKEDRVALKEDTKENGEQGSKKSGEIKDFVKVNDNTYLPIREGETEDEVKKSYNERQEKYRRSLEPEVSKNLRDPRRLWDQDLADTYIEMNEKGEFKDLTGAEKNKFTRDMKNMEGEPFYSPDRGKQRGESKVQNKVETNLKAEYDKKLKEWINSPFGDEEERLKRERAKNEAYYKLNGRPARNMQESLEKRLNETTPKNNWQEQVKANNAKMEKDLKAYVDKYDPFGKNVMNDNIKDGYYEIFRNNERANAKIKVETPNEKYMNVEAYAGYKDKFNDTWGKDGSSNKVVSAKMYTNDEFMEHLEDANWHSERKQLIDANLTNQELAYIKDRTKVTAWGVENLTGKEQVDKLIKEAKSQNNSINNALRRKAYQKYLREHPASKITFDDFKDMRNIDK